MGGNAPIPYRDVKRAFERGGATLLNTNGSHHIWSYDDKEQNVAVHKNKVKIWYIKDARKAWGLRKQDGVSDKQFWNGDWPDLSDKPS